MLSTIVMDEGEPRMSFRWDQTSGEYVDMIFDMLRSLGYLRS